MRFTRTKLAVAGLLTTALAGSTALFATAASADPQPAPTETATVAPQSPDNPTYNPDFGYKPKPKKVRPVPVAFDLQLSDIGRVHVNDVEVTPPLRIVGGNDTQLSNNVDVFAGVNGTLKIWHDALPFPVVNRATCTIGFIQPNGSWRLLAGTGKFAGATASGHFFLTGLLSLRTLYGGCPLAHLSDFQIFRDVLFNKLPGDSIVFDDFAVQGSGLVRIAHPVG